MLKKIALIAASVIAVTGIAVVAMAATKPDQFKIERSIVIKAPAEKMYGILSDFHEWPKWSPFEEKDPDMKRTYSGAATGKGAKYAWEGNGESGVGSMEIVQADAPRKIMIDLHFTKPFKADNVAEFTMVPEGDATRVTWAMSGQNQFIGKVMQVFMSFDDMIGKEFTHGLEKLKSICEVTGK